jgi:hypothetical protein
VPWKFPVSLLSQEDLKVKEAERVLAYLNQLVRFS